MFCSNCGRLLEDGEKWCPVCGTMNEEATAAGVGGDPFGQVNEQIKDELAGKTLKWGIISLVFSLTGCLSLLGFIFSFIAKSKAKEYARHFGQVEGRARVGRILGKVAFGVGLGLSIYFAVCIGLGVMIALSEAGVF